MDRSPVAPLDLGRVHAQQQPTPRRRHSSSILTRITGLLTGNPPPAPPTSQRSQRPPSINRSLSSSPMGSPSSPQVSPSREPIEGYKVGGLLGTGSYARVYRATRNTDGRHVAIKCVAVPPGKQTYAEHVESEVEALRMLALHPGVMHLYEHWFHDVSCVHYLVLEHCETDLLSVMRAMLKGAVEAPLSVNSGALLAYLPEEVVRVIFRQVAEALAFAHAQQYAHLDLKLENIMFVRCPRIKECADLELRVGDWGFSRFLVPGGFHGFRGSTHYASPELLLDMPFTGVQADSWALGVVLYAMLAMALPFRNLEGNADERHRAVHGQYPPLPARVSPEAAELVRGLLAPVAGMRTTATQASRSRWTLKRDNVVVVKSDP